MNGRVLIACVGNIFCGDDAVGVEVAKVLRQTPLPANIDVVDFGIRGHDLAHALISGYRAVILVDALARNRPPGTVLVLEPDLRDAPRALDPHTLDPWAVIGMAREFGEPIAALVIVGCEPASLDFDELGSLSPAVRAAVPSIAQTAMRLAQARLQECQTCTSSELP